MYRIKDRLSGNYDNECNVWKYGTYREIEIGKYFKVLFERSARGKNSTVRISRE